MSQLLGNARCQQRDLRELALVRVPTQRSRDRQHLGPVPSLLSHLMPYSGRTATDLRLHVGKRVAVIALLPRVLTVPTLVLLTGGLSSHSQALSDLWPEDAKSHSVVDEHGQLGVQLLSLVLGSADPLKHLGPGKPGDALGRPMWGRGSPYSVIGAGLDPLRQSSP